MRRLWSDPAALSAVREMGLSDETIRRFRFGLNEPYMPRGSDRLVQRALAFPILRADGARSSRWGYLNLEGITGNPQHSAFWSAGSARSYYSRSATVGSTLFLVASPQDVWMISQLFGGAEGNVVVASRTHFEGVPGEWRDRGYWQTWGKVVLGLSELPTEDDLARQIGLRADRELHRCSPPGGGTWLDLVRMGGSAVELRAAIDGANPWLPVAAVTMSEQRRSIAGDFAADPVAIEGALIGGCLHYPITLERRELEDQGGAGTVIVQRYVTRVLRSDGVLLDVESLPAPRGTPTRNRILALTDGTRIISAPQPNGFDTWSYPSIERFIAARDDGAEPRYRALPRLLADVEAYLRSCIWLPHDEDYALATLFVAATFVYRAFAVFPILLVNGPRGSGKSELGQAMASICCNGLVAGKVTPAGLVRILAESRGTVVLDDLEAIGGRRSGGEEIVQILKVSYKSSTARRISPARDGHVEVLDFFAPKIVTNISGADAILLSRMLSVRTGVMPDGASLLDVTSDVSALRDELHTWAMCEVGRVAAAYQPIAAEVRSRCAEITAPLRAIASISNVSAWQERLEMSLAIDADVVSESPERTLDRVLGRLVQEERITAVAMPRLLLEMAAGVRGPMSLPSAETLGRMLLAISAREGNDPVERRRLFGEVTRIYHLSPRYSPPASERSATAPKPFEFCGGVCSSCRYEEVCEDAVPWLRPAALRRR